jgi:hypothetical protein
MYCAARHTDGWYCVLAVGHDGSHLSIDNTRLWRGTPGRPVLWVQDLTPEQTDELERQTNPTLTQGEMARLTENKPRFTGRPCENCNSMNTIQNGKCLLCMECGQTGECG